MGAITIKFWRNKISLSSILQYICLYLMFICHDAAIYRENTMLFRILIVLFSLLMIVMIKKLRKLSYKLSYNIVAYLLVVSVYLLILGERNLLLNYLECILITYITYTIDKDRFCERFVKMCMFFCVTSLIFYTLGVIAPNVLLKIYSKENGVIWANAYGWQYYMRGRFLYVVRISELNRNNSIFTEPGIWQIILNTSLFMLLFMQDSFKNIDDKHKKWWIVLLMITILTAGTTTGYLALAMIVGVYLISHRKIKSSNKKTRNSIYHIMIIVVALGLLGLIFDCLKNGQGSILYKKVLLKIFETTSAGTSGHARYSMMQICIKLALTHFFGVGEDYLSKLILATDKGANGAIIIHSFASIGIIPVIMILAFYYGRLFRKRIPKRVSILLLLLYLNTAFAQSRLLYPALIIMPIIYYDYYYKKRDMRRVCNE